MYRAFCRSENPGDAKFCSKCGKQIPEISEKAAEAGTANPPQRPFDPQLVAYELLRRVVTERPPFKEWRPEPERIPAGFKTDVDIAVHAYQLCVFLVMAENVYGLGVAEKIRTHILLLSSFDTKLDHRLPALFEAFRTAVAVHNPNSSTLDLVDDPAAKFHSTLAACFMKASGWPEERQAELWMPLGECLQRGRIWAEEVFGPELRTAVQVAGTFEWSESPGPFEQQLHRQQNNPLFPATARTVSARQVTEARVADLRQTFSFMQCYEPFVRRGLSLGRSTVQELSDFMKEAIDLSEKCSLLGDYFVPEAEVLNAAAESAERLILETAKDHSLEDIFRRYRALSVLGALWQKIGIGLPPGCDREDYAVRSLLSEELATIRGFAAAASFADAYAESLRVRAERIIAEAVRAGMSRRVGNAKLAALRLGLERSRPGNPPGLWTRLKGIVRRGY